MQSPRLSANHLKVATAVATLLALGPLGPRGEGMAGAQSRVSGVLFDSLRSQRPISAAQVLLVGTGQSATTDREGRFSFAAVPAGRHAIAYWAAWLDSLAVPALRREVEVMADGRAVDASLGTPSPGSYQQAACGAALEAGQGVLIGEARAPGGEPASGMPVLARWTETVLGMGRLSSRVVGATDTTSESGFFSLCGVPLDEAVSLTAGDAAHGSGEVIAMIGRAPVVRRDLVVALAGERTRVLGRVVTQDGAPLGGVSIVVIGDSSWRAATDDSGRFAIDGVPRRSAQLVARAVGFQPATLDVEPLSARTELAALALEKVPFELARVRVDGRVMTREELDFEHRRRMGLGSFVTEEEVRKYPQFSPTALYNYTPRAFLSCPPRGARCTLFLSRGNEACRPMLFVDGVREDDTAQEFWLQRAKRVEVYRANTAPPLFTDFKGCGVIAVWTR